MSPEETRDPVQSNDEENNVFQRLETDLHENRDQRPDNLSSRTSDRNRCRLRSQKKDVVIVGMKDGLNAYLSRRNSKPSKATNGGGIGISKRTSTLEEEEALVRSTQETNPFKLLIMGNYAALKVMGLYLLTLDAILACALSAGLTVYWYMYGENRESWTGGGMDWVILGFAVVTPMSVSIGIVFRRREEALVDISRIRSFAYQIYLAHCLWDWDTNDGRAGCTDMDWLEHTDKVMAQLIGIGDELCRFLSLPTMSRSRHRMTASGRREAARTVELGYRLFNSFYTRRMTMLTTYAEDLKLAGLGSSEISRIRQYERFIGEAVEHLRMIKMYRSPQALRSFGRIFTLLLPPFYAPTFAQISHDLNSLGMGIMFAIITAMGLTALFESIQVLEDPFVAFLTLDGIDVREEFQVLHWQQLVNTREMIFPSAPPFLEDEDDDRSLDAAHIVGQRNKRVVMNQQKLQEQPQINQTHEQRPNTLSELTLDQQADQFHQQLHDDDDEAEIFADLDLLTSVEEGGNNPRRLSIKRTSAYELDASDDAAMDMSRSLRPRSHHGVLRPRSHHGVSRPKSHHGVSSYN